MPIRIIILVSFVSIIFLYGCSFDGRTGYKTDDPIVMDELQKELKEKKIPFEVDKEGFIRYSSKYESDVESSIKSVDQYLHGGIVSKYDEKVSNRYLRELLAKKGMKYRLEKRADGVWTRWYPENDKQRKAISNEVVEHYFNYKKKELNNCDRGPRSSSKMESTSC